jgi:hypothetical protein
LISAAVGITFNLIASFIIIVALEEFIALAATTLFFLK